MISRVALRRVASFLTTKQQTIATKHKFITTRFIQTTTSTPQCEDKPPTTATENTFDIDEMLLHAADSEIADLEIPPQEAAQEVEDDGNFNYDEMILNTIEFPDAFDLQDIPAVEENVEGEKCNVVVEAGEENFNYDDMILNSAVEGGAGLDVEGDVDVDSFLSRQSDDIRTDILGRLHMMVLFSLVSELISNSDIHYLVEISILSSKSILKFPSMSPFCSGILYCYFNQNEILIHILIFVGFSTSTFISMQGVHLSLYPNTAGRRQASTKRSNNMVSTHPQQTVCSNKKASTSSCFSLRKPTTPSLSILPPKRKRTNPPRRKRGPRSLRMP